MSGHSKYSNIKSKKEKTDAQKSKIFTKIGKEISVAVRQGGADPNSNSKLKKCIEKAKSFNVPNDNIEKIIKKAASSNFGDDRESFVYEGYGPGGIAFMLNILTDNKNRASSNIRNHFSKYGGNLGTPGCVSFMFDEKGVIIFEKKYILNKNILEDKFFNIAIEAGASDFKSKKDYFIIVTEKNNFEEVKNNLINAGFENFTSELSMIPKSYQKIEDEKTKQKVLNLIDALENDEDVQSVWNNYEFDE